MSAHSSSNLAIPEPQKPKAYPNHYAMRRAVAVCSHPGLDGTDMALLHILAENTNEKGYSARPGNRLLKAASRLSERGVQYRLKKLIGYGLIERTETPVGGSGRAAVYRICLESPDFLDWEEFQRQFLKKTPQNEVRGSEENISPATPQNEVRGSGPATPQREAETPQSGGKTPQPYTATHQNTHLKEQVDFARSAKSTKASKEERDQSRSAPPSSPAGKGSARGDCVAAQAEDSRLKAVLRFYGEEREKRRDRAEKKLIHPIRPQDLAALEELLREEPKCRALVICGWMQEAFDSDGKQDYPFEDGIKSLSYFVKRRREREFSSTPYDIRLDGRTWASLTVEEHEACIRNPFIVMPHDTPKDDKFFEIPEIFGEYREFFKPPQ